METNGIWEPINEITECPFNAPMDGMKKLKIKKKELK